MGAFHINTIKIFRLFFLQWSPKFKIIHLVVLEVQNVGDRQFSSYFRTFQLLLDRHRDGTHNYQVTKFRNQHFIPNVVSQIIFFLTFLLLFYFYSYLSFGFLNEIDIETFQDKHEVSYKRFLSHWSSICTERCTFLHSNSYNLKNVQAVVLCNLSVRSHAHSGPLPCCFALNMNTRIFTHAHEHAALLPLERKPT